MRRSLIAILLCFGAGQNLFAQTDPLSDLMRSPQMQEFASDSSKLRSTVRNKNNWMDPKSNFGALFNGSHGSEKVMEWLTSRVMGYSRFNEQFRKEREFLRVHASFSNRDQLRVYQIKIAIPHPRYLSASELDLVEEYKAYKYPQHKFDKELESQIRGYNVRIYSSKGEACTAIIPLARGGLLNVIYEKCEKTSELVNFVRTLDIGRLNRKLES